MTDGTSTEQAPGRGATAEPTVAASGQPVAPGSDATVEATEAIAIESALAEYEPELPTRAPLPRAHLDHALPDDGVAPGHIRVECPNCSSLWEGNDLRPHAEWFCGTCDFPLFWARSGVPGASDVGGAFARLPGTDGRDSLLSLACPTCGELNPPVPTANCLRCGSPLSRPVVPVPLAPPAPVVVVPPPPLRRRRIWPWVVATCVLATALLVAIIVAVNRG